MDLIWAYQINFWTVGYLALGISAVGIEYQIPNGLFATVTFMLYPVHVVGIMAVEGFAGSYFEEAVSRFEVQY